MGYFTWTLANKKPVKLQNGEYATSCKLKYGQYGAILCPDNTLIKEPCYEGYGMFDDKDVFDLVVDWNKNYLADITRNIPSTYPTDDDIKKAAIAYQEDRFSDLDSIVTRLAKKIPCLKSEWKRWVGIMITDGERNETIPYPIKIVSLHKPIPYNDLAPSIHTQ